MAFGRHHFGFYKLLRLVVCGASAYSAFVAGRSRRTGWAWTLGLIAVLFNPCVPVYLSRADWTIIDPVVAVILIISLAFVREERVVSTQDVER
jgi:hypothetical protein